MKNFQTVEGFLEACLCGLPEEEIHAELSNYDSAFALIRRYCPVHHYDAETISEVYWNIVGKINVAWFEAEERRKEKEDDHAFDCLLNPTGSTRENWFGEK